MAIKEVNKDKIRKWGTLNGSKVPMEIKALSQTQKISWVIELYDVYEYADTYIYVMENLIPQKISLTS